MLKTNVYSLVVASIRLAAIIALANLIPSLLMMMFEGQKSSDWGDGWWKVVAITTSLSLFVILLFWMFPHWLAKLAFLNASDEQFDYRADPQALLIVAIALIGLWQLLTAANQLVWNLASWWSLNRSQFFAEYSDYQAIPGMPANMVYAMVAAAIGYGLIRFAPNLARKIMGWQSADLKSEFNGANHSSDSKDTSQGSDHAS